ncbi:hypothetical protein C1H46_003118 [Malus baccata]|uniref:Uncharacterized protein n=1 Tax=Malus baccata TaxID=106549 RepID=A0A540NJ83_MALBA|nr:hypothetical protein C1H46_003118 [Malus baccata]
METVAMALYYGRGGYKHMGWQKFQSQNFIGWSCYILKSSQPQNYLALHKESTDSTATNHSRQR